jgi:calcineurin-like phosphoesterase family protein
MTKVWFTSDTHFGHRNVIQYCKRPYASVDEMNEALIANWNAVVSPEDVVYHNGDVAMCSARRLAGIVWRLNGTIHLTPGNHDKEALKLKERWASIEPYREITIDKQKIVLCHYAFAVFNGSHRGTIHLHGHSHGKLPGHRQRLDIGVDCWDYRPVSLEQIQARLKTLPVFEPVDHHGAARHHGTIE